jgi:hypothetical protein
MTRPAFKCVLSRISAQYRGRAISCKAFDIQVRRVEVDKVVGVACKALPAQGPQRIMLYSDRFNNPHRFAAAVMLQAKHPEAHRIVAFKGILTARCSALKKPSKMSSPRFWTSFQPTPQPLGIQQAHRLVDGIDLRQIAVPRLGKESLHQTETPIR